MGGVALGTNLSSLTAQRNLLLNSLRLEQAGLRLASGLRINRASDDAAGLAISSALNSDARVYSQAMRNGNDSISALSIADGTLSQLNNVLIRTRELATQAANGTFARIQRLSIDVENAALGNELNRLLRTTTFNGLSLLSASIGRINTQLGYGTDGSIGFKLAGNLRRNVGDGEVSVSTYTTGSANLNNLETGDLNGDGNLDLVTSHSAPGHIRIHYGNGDGTFQSPISIAFASTPGLITIADINSDGKSDIVVGHGNNIGVILGQGQGQFSSTMTYSIGVSTSGNNGRIRFGDINGDGKLDLAAGSLSQSAVSIAFGNGNGSFGAATTYAYNTLRDLELADINNDGRADLLVTRGPTVDVAFSQGSSLGAFTSVTPAAAYQGFDIGDVNFDGIPDLVAAVSGVGVQIFLGNGNGTFSASHSYSEPVGSFQPVLRDFDVDGILDIVSATSGRSYYLKGVGDGTFGPVITLETNNSAIEPLIGDLNGDGVPDFIGISGTDVTIGLQTPRTTTDIARFNLTTQATALDALSVIDSLLEKIAEEQGNIGAALSRIGAALGTLRALRENTLSASSRIESADVAVESAAYVRQTILQQIQASVLAQANQAPTLALLLLN